MLVLKYNIICILYFLFSWGSAQTWFLLCHGEGWWYKHYNINIQTCLPMQSMCYVGFKVVMCLAGKQTDSGLDSTPLYLYGHCFDGELLWCWHSVSVPLRIGVWKQNKQQQQHQQKQHTHPQTHTHTHTHTHTVHTHTKNKIWIASLLQPLPLGISVYLSFKKLVCKQIWPLWPVATPVKCLSSLESQWWRTRAFTLKSQAEYDWVSRVTS